MSCGPKETDYTNAKELEDVAALRASLTPFEGSYAGTVIDGTRIPVEFELRVVDVADGTNDSREVVYRPELRGFFIRSDYVSMTPAARRPIRVRYYKTDGRISVDNTDNIVSPTPNQGVVNMSGFLRGDTIEGNITFTIGSTVSGPVRATRQ